MNGDYLIKTWVPVNAGKKDRETSSSRMPLPEQEEEKKKGEDFKKKILTYPENGSNQRREGAQIRIISAAGRGCSSVEKGKGLSET